MLGGANLAAVQRIMRHENPKTTTQIYGHLTPSYLRSEANRLRFGPQAEGLELEAVPAPAKAVGGGVQDPCWARARRIRYLVQDAAAVELRQLRRWEHTALQRAHLRIIERLVQPPKILGPQVASVLDAWQTIRVAYLSIRTGMVPALVRASLRLAWGRGRRPPIR